jgi:hypothetical protein
MVVSSDFRFYFAYRIVQSLSRGLKDENILR